MRRITGVTGAALVVLGFVGFIVGGSVAALAGPWFPVLPLVLVPLGFVLIWEAQITWPQDGPAYSWRRRLAGLIVVLIALASTFVTRGLLMANLPNNWIAGTSATLTGVIVGDVVFRRLRDAVRGRFGSTADTKHG